MVGAKVDAGVDGVCEVGIFQMCLEKQRAFKVGSNEIGVGEQGGAKVDLFGTARFHDKTLHKKPEKVTIIYNALVKFEWQRV